MNNQTEIDFTDATLRRHNNQASEMQALENVHHFVKQTKWVYEQLLKGRKLNGDIALAEYGIRDLRARIFSIRKSGINVKDETIKGAKGMKEYYL